MHNSDAISILNRELDCPCFLFIWVPTSIYSKNENVKKHRLRIETFVVLLVIIFELVTPANDVNIPRDCDSRAEMSARIWKGGFGRNTLTLEL